MDHFSSVLRLVDDIKQKFFGRHTYGTKAEEIYCASSTTEQNNIDLNWNTLLSLCAAVLRKYPLGVTSTSLASELDISLRNRSKLDPRKSFEHSLSKLTIKFILKSRQVLGEGNLECQLGDVCYLGVTQIRMMKLTNLDNSACIDMYMHQKLLKYESSLKGRMLRLTSLKLHEISSSKAVRLLPTEHIVCILNPIEEDLGAFTSSYKRLNDVQNNERHPQFYHNLRLKIHSLDPVKTIHYRDGSSARLLVVTAVDLSGERIQLHFWNEECAFERLFGEGDTLLLHDIQFIRGEENWHLEYNYETLIYVIPAPTYKELVSSQYQNQRDYVLKDESGALDYSVYPLRVCTTDVESNMSGFSLLLTVESLKFVNRKSLNGMNWNFELIGRDEFGSTKVLMMINSAKDLSWLDVGHAILMEKLLGIDKQVAYLDKSIGGNLWNATLSCGLLSSPCFLHIISCNQLKEQSTGTFTVYAGLSDCSPRDGKSLVCKTHLMCGSSIDMYWDCCDNCNMEDLTEAQNGSSFSTNTWNWTFNVVATMTDRHGQSLKVVLSQRVCEYITQSSAKRMSSLPCSQQLLAVRAVPNERFLMSVALNRSVAKVEDLVCMTEETLRGYHLL